MEIEIAYADPQNQIILKLEVPAKTVVRSAVEVSRILELCPSIGVEADNVNALEGRLGIFGERVSLDTVLKEGDRIEILRYLLREPKQARLEKVKVLNKKSARERQKIKENAKFEKKSIRDQYV